MSIQLAGCILTDSYDRILLLHRSTDTQSEWELPGGKVNDGETAEQAAVRELTEELGIQIQLRKSLGSGSFEDEVNEYTYIWFQAVITGGTPTVLEPYTFDDFEYFELEDMMSLALSANMRVLVEDIYSGAVTLETS